MSYNYKEGKIRIEEILHNDLEILDKAELPSDDSFTYNVGYKSLVTAIVVDIRNSSKMFAKDDAEEVAKMVKSFTSEIIEILRIDDNLREIGIRGDSVYAIYSTPLLADLYECFGKVCYVNTLIKMLNVLLTNNNFDEIRAGIGLATDKELVIMAGREESDINSKIWIGDAVTKASKLSSLGDKDSKARIIISTITHFNLVKYYKEYHKDIEALGNFEKWFTKEFSQTFGTYYASDLFISEFDSWIEAGMAND